MKYEVVTCDGCNKDLTDARWHEVWRTTGPLGNGPRTEVDACSLTCLLKALTHATIAD